MKNWFCCNSGPNDQIVTKFCVCYNSTAVASCAKFCVDQLIRIWMRAKLNLHQIWDLLVKIASEMVHWPPELQKFYILLILTPFSPVTINGEKSAWWKILEIFFLGRSFLFNGLAVQEYILLAFDLIWVVLLAPDNELWNVISTG